MESGTACWFYQRPSPDPGKACCVRRKDTQNRCHSKCQCFICRNTTDAEPFFRQFFQFALKYFFESLKRNRKCRLGEVMDIYDDVYLYKQYGYVIICSVINSCLYVWICQKIGNLGGLQTLVEQAKNKHAEEKRGIHDVARLTKLSAL